MVYNLAHTPRAYGTWSNVTADGGAEPTTFIFKHLLCSWQKFWVGPTNEPEVYFFLVFVRLSIVGLYTFCAQNGDEWNFTQPPAIRAFWYPVRPQKCVTQLLLGARGLRSNQSRENKTENRIHPYSCNRTQWNFLKIRHFSRWSVIWRTPLVPTARGVMSLRMVGPNQPHSYSNTFCVHDKIFEWDQQTNQKFPFFRFLFDFPLYGCIRFAHKMGMSEISRSPQP